MVVSYILTSRFSQARHSILIWVHFIQSAEQ